MTGYAQVQTLLDTATAAVSGIPSVNTENERIKTSPLTSFTRTTLAPSETVAEGIGSCGLDRLEGIYIIDLFYPKDGGVADPNADADTLTIAFQSGTTFIDGTDKVEILNSYLNGSTPDLEKFYRKQVIVEWFARRQRTL